MVTRILGQHSDVRSMKSIAKEVEVVDVVVSQRTGTSEHRDFKEFPGPTAHELKRFIHRTTGDCLSAQTNERDNHFASLLNQGSSLE